MKDKKFKLSHLILGTAILLIIEAVLLWAIPRVSMQVGIILLSAILGGGMNIYVAIQAIEEVRSHLRMLVLLWLILLEFIIFFSCEYWFLLQVQPMSFPTLTADPLSIILHSTMVFIFNPLYIPATAAGRILLLVNTLWALGLVLFILQNVWQLRSKNA